MKDIIKGIIIGMGKIIPGVSGSVLAITLGVYEKSIKAFNNIFKDYRNTIFLFKLSIGILISITLFSKIIIYMLNNYFTYTIFIFTGLILGSIKDITSNINYKYWYLTLIAFILIISFSFINIGSNNHISNKLFILYYFISGFIESVSSIIPGISGTAILMMFGTYDEVINIFSNIININYMISNLSIIIPFIIGIILGLIISIKIISYLFNRYKSKMYNVILGLLLGSIYIMLKGCNYTLPSTIVSSILLVLSYLSIKKVNHFF